MIVAPRKFDVLKTTIRPRSGIEGKYAGFKAGVNVKATLSRLTRPFCQYLGHISSDPKSLCLFH